MRCSIKIIPKLACQTNLVTKHYYKKHVGTNVSVDVLNNYFSSFNLRIFEIYYTLLIPNWEIPRKATKIQRHRARRLKGPKWQLSSRRA